MCKVSRQENTKEPVIWFLTLIEMGEESTGEALYSHIMSDIFKDESIYL